MTGRPLQTPIGLQLTRTSRAVARAFEDALAVSGGSLPVWLILLSLMAEDLPSQRQLAESVGVQEATISHHLNAMVTNGLLTRTPDPANRRAHHVRLTADGEATFQRLRGTAIAFDTRLRAGLSESELSTLRRLLGRLAENAAALPRPPSEAEMPVPPNRSVGDPGTRQEAP
jgi:MarR family transcriptional regulator for hemolysin